MTYRLRAAVLSSLVGGSHDADRGLRSVGRLVGIIPDVDDGPAPLREPVTEHPLRGDHAREVSHEVVGEAVGGLPFDPGRMLLEREGRRHCSEHFRTWSRVPHNTGGEATAGGG